MARPVLRAALVVLVVAMATATCVDPARAEGGIEFSLDGHTWSDSVREPLFDHSSRWVPGDREVASLHVRNQGPSGASIAIAVRSGDPDGLLVTEDIVVDARVPGGTWIRLVNGRPSARLTSRTVSQDGSVRVDVRIAFDPAAANRSRRSTLPLELVVRLTETSPDAADGATPDGELPTTGTAVPEWLVPLAAMMIGVGVALARKPLGGGRHGQA